MKKSLKVLSFVFLTSLGVGALALNNNVVITNAEETDVTYVDTTFFVQPKDRPDEKVLDIIISFDEFNFPQDADTEKDMGIYEQSAVEAYSSLNFFNYIQVNGVDLARWGQTSENGLTKAGYNPINGDGCNPSIVLRYNYSQETYPNGFPLETVTIKKDFEFPSYYLKTGKEGEKVIYRSVSELKCEKGQYNWEWINKGSSDVTTIEYIENEKDPTLPGYLAFKLTNSDYSSFDGEISKDWYTLPNNVTDQNEDHIVTMDGKFIEEMPGYYLAKVNEIEENITSINIPKGTIFPSIQAIKLMNNTYNSGKYPATGFATQKDKVFVKKGNEFVCEEDLAELKQEAISLLEESFIESDYKEPYWEYIQSQINLFKNDVEKCETTSEVNDLASDVYVELKSVPDKDGVDDFLTFQDESITNLSTCYDPDDYYENELKIINDLKDEAVELINDAKSYNMVGSIVEEYKFLIGDVLTKEEADILNDLRESECNEIEEYKKDVVYREKEAALKEEYKTNAINAIQTLTHKDEMDSIVQTYKVLVDSLVNAKQYEDYEKQIDGLISDLSNYKKDVIYRSEETSARNGIISSFTSQANSLKLQYGKYAEAKELFDEAIENIDKLKTKAERDAEDLILSKAKYKNDIDTYMKGIDFSLYSEENQILLGNISRQAKSNIDAATSENEVTEIYNKFLNDVKNVKTIQQSQGCQGSIVSCSIFLSLVSLTGICLLVLRKKKEN